MQPSSEVDVAELSVRYRSLQQAVHPDRFMRECDRSQRLAQQQAAQVNVAYQTLKSPLLRAQYLLELAGQHRAQETTLRDPGFLMQQMALRERLDEASSNVDALEHLLSDVRAASRHYLQEFSVAWQKKEWHKAQLLVDKLQFSSKLEQEIDERQARLLDD
jgi:molecular chaperone HscB